jgi:hypothetical protein
MACLTPHMRIWGFRFNFEARSLALQRVWAFATSFVSSWQVFSFVSLCNYVPVQCVFRVARVRLRLALASLPFGAHAVKRIPRPSL